MALTTNAFWSNDGLGGVADHPANKINGVGQFGAYVIEESHNRSIGVGLVGTVGRDKEMIQQVEGTGSVLQARG